MIRGRDIGLLVLSALLLSVAVSAWNYLGFQSSAERRLQLAESRSADAYRSILESYRQFAEMSVASIVRNSRKAALLKSLNQDHLPAARGELYRELYPMYSLLSERDMPVMQFTTADGTAQLRMHMPEAYGDTATIRPLIADALADGKPRSGFQYSSHISGFRFINPVVIDGEHAGVFEIGISFTALRRLLVRQLGDQAMGVRVLLHDPDVHDAMGGGNTDHSVHPLLEISSVNPEYLVRNALHSYQGDPPEMLPPFAAVVETEIDLIPGLSERMEAGESISLRVGAGGFKNDYFANLIPVLDGRGETSAYVLIYQHDEDYDEALKKALAGWVAGHFLIGLLLLLALQALRSRRNGS